MSHFAKSQLSLPRSQCPKTPKKYHNVITYMCSDSSECPVGQLESFKIHAKGLSTAYIEMAYPGKLRVEKPEWILAILGDKDYTYSFNIF